MKNFLKKMIEKLFEINVHAFHLDIKGKKSGGYRDLNGTDYNTNKYK